MAVVDATQGDSPKIVFPHNYTNLHLPDNFDATHVLVALSEKTDLLSWMRPAHPVAAPVDRVVVHLEQIALKNKAWKQLSMDLGRQLQGRTTDKNKCIVKMSQPHIHRATGPAFRLGDRIVEELQLTPEQSTNASTLAERNPAAGNQSACLPTQNMSDVEPHSSDDKAVSPTKASIYHHKKRCPVTYFDTSYRPNLINWLIC